MVMKMKFSRAMDRKVQRSGPSSWRDRWPPRSPDLTLLDFFEWGFLKSRVYSGPPLAGIEDLLARIQAACLEITPEMLRGAVGSLQGRCEECIRRIGEQFEQHLQWKCGKFSCNHSRTDTEQAYRPTYISSLISDVLDVDGPCERNLIFIMRRSLIIAFFLLYLF